jgi:hypothetical protein
VLTAAPTPADESWFGIPAQVVLDAIEVSSFRFDCRTGTGVVLLMLTGLAIDGCLTAFAENTAAAQAMNDASCAYRTQRSATALRRYRRPGQLGLVVSATLAQAAGSIAPRRFRIAAPAS